MARRIRTLESTPIDIFEALKRAMLRRGFIRQKSSENIEQATNLQPTALETTVTKSHDILFKANTVFPFTLFPDTVTLDREKVTFATRLFFGVAKITSVPVRDILSVEADIGIFFGSVHTSSRYFITDPKSIKYLWRKDAVELQRLLQGYVIVFEQDIECSHISKEELKDLLHDLGKGDTN